MKVRIQYSSYRDLEIPDEIIELNDDGSFGSSNYEFDEMFKILKQWIPKNSKVEGWEYKENK